MISWYAERTPARSARVMIAGIVLALVLVAAVPLALLAAVIMMLLGHVIGGLAVFGGSVLAAVVAVALAGMSGMRRLRKLLSGSGFRVVQLDSSQYADVTEPASTESGSTEPQSSGYSNVVQLDRSQYTEVR